MKKIKMYQILSRKLFLPPANEVWGKVIFLHLFSHSVHGGGGGGNAWLLLGGHAWLFLGGGVRGCSGGGVVCGCSQGGHAWLLRRGWRAWDTTRYGDTINERAVRILLECILVNNDLKELGCCTNYFVFLSTEERLDIFTKNASCTGKA